MAILSIDTYLKKQISTILNSFLQNPYIIREVLLRDFSKSNIDSFVNTFCKTDSSNGYEIPVMSTFPQSSEQRKAFILVQFKGAQEPEEKDGSLGSHKGNSNAETGELERETHEVNVYYDTSVGHDVCYFEVDKPISKYTNINFDNLSLNRANINIDFDTNRIYVPDSIIHNDTFKSTITYTARAVDSNNNNITDNKEKLIGFDLQEVYTIDTLSENIDTIRCLNAILKAIFITMRTNSDEQTEYRLQSLVFHGMDLVQAENNASTSASGQQIYYQRVEVGYDTTYSLPNVNGFDIKNFKTNY